MGRARRGKGGGGRGRLSGAGGEGTARHRRRDKGPPQRGRGLRALPLPAPMAPRPPSGTEPQSIQQGRERRGPRLRGWLSLSPPHPQQEGRKDSGCRWGSLKPPRSPGAPTAPLPPRLRYAYSQPRLRLPRPPRHPTHFIGRIAQAPAPGCFRRRPKSASPRLTRRRREAGSLRRHLVGSAACPDPGATAPQPGLGPPRLCTPPPLHGS